MKKCFKILLLIQMVIVCFVSLTFPVSARHLPGSGYCGDLRYTFDVFGGTMQLKIYGTGAMPNYATLTESPFRDTLIRSIITVGSVTSIGDRAFYSCNSLTSVTLGEKINKFGNAVFLDCTSLTSITVDANNKYFTNDEHGVLFDKDKTKLVQYPVGKKETSYIIPDGVTTIGKYAFATCSNIRYITIPDTVTKIDDYAFYGYYNDIKEIYYGGTQEQWQQVSIGLSNDKLTSANIYCKCLHINAISYPEQISTCSSVGYTEGTYCSDCAEWIEGHEEIPTRDYHPNKTNYSQQDVTCVKSGYTAGVYCPSCRTWIEGHEEIPAKGHTDIDSNRFCEVCEKYTEELYDTGSCGSNVIYDWYVDGTLYISGYGDMWQSDYLFNGSNIKSLIIKDGVTTIPDNVFAVCYSLSKVVIPVSITSIGYYAFYDSCIRDVYYTGTKEQWNNVCGIDNFYGVNIHFGYVYDTPKTPNALDTPSNLTTTQDANTITLSWTAVDGSIGYKVYQMINEKWVSVGTTTSTTKTISELSPGTKYSFAVKAAAGVNGKVAWATDYTTINTATKADKPSKVTSAQNTSAIKLAWSKVTGATGYRIYYKSGNTWKVCVSTTSATSHTFKNLKAGAKYTFAIRPYILVDGVVIWSDFVEYTASTTPATVTAKATSPSKGKINLTWNNVDGDIDGYRVYYKVGNGAYKIYKNYSSAQNLTFSNLKSGTKYTFAVRAGIKTSGGVVWSTYKEAAVTVK